MCLFVLLKKLAKNLKTLINQDLLEAVEQLKQTLKDSNETNEKKIEALTKEKHDLNVLCEVLKKVRLLFQSNSLNNHILN